MLTLTLIGAFNPMLFDSRLQEMTLLGQNVNSYRDLSDTSAVSASLATVNSDGFATLYKNKEGGLRFAELLHQVSQVRKPVHFIHLCLSGVVKYTLCALLNALRWLC